MATFHGGRSLSPKLRTILADHRSNEPKVIFIWGAKFNPAKSYGVNFCKVPFPIFNAMMACNPQLNYVGECAVRAINYLMFWQCAIVDAKVPMSKLDVLTLCQTR
jgi:hypothetical protein